MIKLKVRLLKSLGEKSIGLIGSRKPQSILFYTRFGIHTFGVKFPIDVVILDKNDRVVALKKGLQPNRLWWWNPVYNKVVELSVNTINTLNIKQYTKIIVDIHNS